MIVYQDKLRALASFKQERQSYDNHWLELQDFFLPRRGRWMDKGKTSENRGNKVNQKLIDPTPRLAVRTAGAGIHAGSTNPSTPWFKLVTPDPELNEFPGVANWLYTVENLMRDVFDRSNLYSVLPTLYSDAIVFGTAPMTILEHPTNVIHCVPHPVGSYYLAKDSDGNLNTKYCQYQQTASQLLNLYPTTCPQSVQAAVRNQQSQQYFDVLHIIEPNTGRRWGDYSNRSMPFSSCYLFMGEEVVLKESGFEDNPIAGLIWETTEVTDPYGNSPGMDVLGCAKAMQVQQKRKAATLDKIVDPPMVGDPALQNHVSTLLPGGVTWAGFTANGAAPKFQPTYQINPSAVPGLIQDIEDIRGLVEEGMYTNLFLAITRADPRNASVPEIAARREEQILGLGPMLQNHRQGLIKPIIDRTFYVMMRQGRLPPPPPELEGVELGVEMVGLLAQALKAVRSTGIERFMGYAAMAAKAQADSGAEPTALDKVDFDQSIDEMALSIGVPPTIVRSDDAVAEMRQRRAEAQQQQQVLANAEQEAKALQSGAKAAKDLSETKVQGGNALEAIA